MAQVQALSEFGRHINQYDTFLPRQEMELSGAVKISKEKSVLSKVSDLGAYSFVTHTVLTLA